MLNCVLLVVLRLKTPSPIQLGTTAARYAAPTPAANASSIPATMATTAAVGLSAWVMGRRFKDVWVRALLVLGLITYVAVPVYFRLMLGYVGALWVEVGH